MSGQDNSTPSPDKPEQGKPKRVRKKKIIAKQVKTESTHGRLSPEERYGLSENFEENLERITSVPAFAQNRRYRGKIKIENYWKQVIEACHLGYEITAICKALGFNRKIFYEYLKQNPEKRREINNAQNTPRDLCVKAVLDAAQKGVWVAAAWWLERTRGMEFAKPEVKLQYWDRMVANDSVEQRIAGKTIAEITQEMQAQYKDHERVGKYFEQSGSGEGRPEAGKDGSNVDLPPDANKEGSDTGS